MNRDQFVKLLRAQILSWKEELLAASLDDETGRIELEVLIKKTEMFLHDEFDAI